MVFTSFVFLFVFLPLFSLFYSLQGSLKYKNFVLLFSSLIFYYYGEQFLVLVMIFSGSIDFLTGWLIGSEYSKKQPDHQKAKYFLILSLLVNLGLLAYFKYSGFFLKGVQSFLRNLGITPLDYNLKIALPLGISFYTFQSMSYTIDVYRRETKYQRNYFDFLAYLTMFPQLVAGPIVRYSDIAKQLKQRMMSVDNVETGAKRFVRGICKKVLIADPMGHVADVTFNLSPSNLDMSTAWLGAIAYTLQIFYDFSGYSDMAIGIGKVLGFDFPENFNYPYISKSIQEFWRRWHISLSTWFRDYSYIPLGGSRHGKMRTYFNLWVVFVLCGLWHGASWHFVAWGVYHGLFLVIERANPFKQHLLPSFIQHVYVIFIIVVGWVLFRADSLSHALAYIRSMHNVSSFGNLSFLSDPNFLIPFSLGVIFSIDRQYRLKLMGKVMDDDKVSAIIYAMGLVLSILLIAGDSYSPFIYFRF